MGSKLALERRRSYLRIDLNGLARTRISVLKWSLLLTLGWLLTGCATAPKPALPSVAHLFPADALVTQRAMLTVRGRQFTLNGYLASSTAGGQRLTVTENFGRVLADVLVKRDGSVHVMRSSAVFRPDWIQRYVAADMQCLFGGAPGTDCPGRMLSPTHFTIERRWYALDLRVVDIKPGAQPPELFDETRKTGP